MNSRCLQIMEELNARGSAEVIALAELMGVSAVTIRKDLSLLEQKGFLKRQHGMAVRVSSDNIGYRMTFDYEVKRRIAKAAAAMIKNGETLMIESGSTCAMLAEELGLTKRDVTIITNSAFIASHTAALSGIRFVLLGGSFTPDAQVMTGPLVRICAQAFFVDKFFIGTDGYDEKQGFTNVDLMRSEAVQAMGEQAQNKIILTDSSKFNRRGVVPLIPTDQVDMVITECIPDNCRASMEAQGVKIVLA